MIHRAIQCVAVCLRVGAFFALGYLAFWFFTIRVGPHPQSLRFAGAQYALVRVLATCDERLSRGKFASCLRKELLVPAARWGIYPLMHALEIRQLSVSSDDPARARCHDFAHLIGEAGSRVEHNIDAVLATCTGLCQAGCYHGAVSGWIAQGKSVIDKLPGLCLHSGLSQDVQSFCFHGVGHAIGEIENETVEQKLKRCDQYPTFGRVSCGVGVFMQLFEFSPLAPDATLTALPPDRPAWCGKLWAPYDEACYSRSGVFEYAQSGSFAGALSICMKEPQMYKKDCIIDTGKSQFFSFPYDPRQIQQAEIFCKTYATTWYSQCIEGILYNSPK